MHVRAARILEQPGFNNISFGGDEEIKSSSSSSSESITIITNNSDGKEVSRLNKIIDNLQDQLDNAINPFRLIEPSLECMKRSVKHNTYKVVETDDEIVIHIPK